MPGHRVTLVLVVAAVASLGVTCGGPSTSPTSTDISRERAIEIARSQVSYQPESIDAEQTTSDGRPVWRVTLRGRLPGQPPGLFETAVVEIDRRTGDVVSISRP